MPRKNRPLISTVAREVEHREIVDVNGLVQLFKDIYHANKKNTRQPVELEALRRTVVMQLWGHGIFHA